MSEIGMLSLFKGPVNTSQSKHHANSFPWARVPKVKLASTIIPTTKTQDIIIVPQLLRTQESLKLKLRKKMPFHQKSLKMLQLLLQQKGKEGEKERVEKAKTEKDRERRKLKAIDNLGSVQSPLSRPHCKCMVLLDQKKMFTFSSTPMD